MLISLKDQVKILQMSRQPSCRDMWEILTWLEHQNQNYHKKIFHKWIYEFLNP